jgi:hypothetical protein
MACVRYLNLSVRSRHSSFSTATGYGLDGWDSVPGARHFYFPHSLQTGSTAHPVTYPVVRGELFAAGAWSWQVTGVKCWREECWNHTSNPPYFFMAWCLIKCRDKLPFYLYITVQISRSYAHDEVHSGNEHCGTFNRTSERMNYWRHALYENYKIVVKIGIEGCQQLLCSLNPHKLITVGIDGTYSFDRQSPSLQKRRVRWMNRLHIETVQLSTP